MGWLDNWIDELTVTVPAVPAARPIAKPAEPPRADLKCVHVQIRAGCGGGDPGETVKGHYSVADGVLTMRDEIGKSTGKSIRLGEDDDPRSVAYRVVREAWLKAGGQNNFNRQLHYSGSSVA
jgi:hypothetical protein